MYKKVKQTWVKHWDFALWDLIVLTISYYVSCFVRFGVHIQKNSPTVVFQMSLVLVLIYFVVSILGRAYKNIIHRNRYQELRAVIIQVLASYAFFAIYMYLTQNAELFSRQVYLVSAVISLILIYGERIIWKRILRLRRLKGKNLPKLILIADWDTVENNVASIRKRRYNAFFVSGIIVMDRDMKGQEINNIPVVANQNDLKKYIASEVVDEVMIDVKNSKKTTELVEFLLEAGITVHISLLSNTMDLPNKTVEKLGAHMVLTTSHNVANGWQLLCKRLMDVVGGIIGLAITGILYLILAPQIKKIDPGPVLFSQERVGQNGRKFKIYKFRSMYMDAEERKKELLAKNEMDGLMFKIKDDPRILPGIGQRIRNWSLDEFPQFLNVLKGDMSMVGTRPPTVKEFEKYELRHKMRLSFKPGITGLWQVSGRNKITDFEEVLRLDSEYIKNWNLRLDIKILLKTIAVVFHRDGSM